ncbi:MAG: aldehyde dehydrogenase family protein, partial [Candidatus Binatia bacterium]
MRHGARMPLRSIDPATGEVLETFAETTPQGLEQVLARAEGARGTWGRMVIAARGVRLHAVARLLRERAASLARVMAREMGKPVVEGEAEIEKCAWVSDYFADEAARMLAPESRGAAPRS